MAMLSARFADAAAARQVSDKFINGMGATPDLVVITQEGARPDGATDAGTTPGHPTAMPDGEATRVSIYDNAIDVEAARDVLEAGGGTDIRPIQ